MLQWEVTEPAEWRHWGNDGVAVDRDTGASAAAESAWARPVGVRSGEILVAAALLATSVFFISQSAWLPFGTVRLPGPGFFPFALGIALGLLALVILIRVLCSASEGESVFLGHRDVLVVFAALIAVAAGFESLGAYATLGGLTAILLLVLARSSLWHAALGTGLGMVAVWAIFKVLLGVQLPAGPF
jgi:Na+-transporting NADH:ubiquinone oxidoreductase subunit NqrB